MEGRRGAQALWDPKSPYHCLLPKFQSTAAHGSSLLSSVDHLLAVDGVGSNPHETACLVKLCDAQDEYYKSKKSMTLHLSKSYRSALQECLIGWSGQSSTTEDAFNTEHLELLKVVYSITHLSETFLLRPNDTLWTAPGALTADTVRYLRHHHLPDPLSSVPPEILEELTHSSQPEQVGGGKLYWDWMHRFVLTGELEQAWALLSRHSACQRCANPTRDLLDEYHRSIVEQDGKGFHLLQGLLLSAPLPGGRSSTQDAGLLHVSEDEEDTTPLLDGVQRLDYQLWDNERTRGSLRRSYDHYAARSAYQTWQDAVRNAGPLCGLLRRVPELKSIVSILSGDFSAVHFTSWEEALCAELLYVRPGLQPRDLHTPVRQAMERFGGITNPTGFDEILLGTMQGKTGRVIEAMYTYGGSSGAALPTTMTSLLTNLLAHTDRKSFESFPYQTELLLAAASGIVASHVDRRDVGVRLATRLLLPHATPKGDPLVTGWIAELLSHHAPTTDTETEGLLELCKGLVRQKSRRILDGCVSVVLSRVQYYHKQRQQWNAVHWMLRGLETELLYLQSKDGKDESSWETILASGTCGRQLVAFCSRDASALLFKLAGTTGEVSVSPDLDATLQVVECLEKDALYPILRRVTEVRLIKQVAEMTEAVVRNVSPEKTLATHIAACLSQSVLEDGTVATLAHPSMYWSLLVLAGKVLDHDEEFYKAHDSAERFSNVSFDVAGIHGLMSVFTKMTMEESKTERISEEEINSMRLGLANGLMRAIVSDNRKSYEARVKLRTGADKKRLDEARSADIATFSAADQELITERMLDF